MLQDGLLYQQVLNTPLVVVVAGGRSGRWHRDDTFVFWRGGEPINACMAALPSAVEHVLQGYLRSLVCCTYSMIACHTMACHDVVLHVRRVVAGCLAHLACCITLAAASSSSAGWSGVAC
jgi:hypothetical protein